ncbi:MAG TPA: DUF6036 family nucleotidyltransferase [Vicinamibacterales bacterium]|jgi:hypothetical protein|nr:DUF6036 family nucleotidyltransferase [Vicinamibacterales bacterium]
MPSPVGELLAAFARAMARARIEWYLFGAQAAILNGAARLTADVDVTVRLHPPATVNSLIQAVETQGFSLRASDRGLIERTRVIPLVHQDTAIPVDAILAGPGLEDQFFDRVTEKDVEGARIPVASAEDLLIMKILAARPKDQQDAVAILAAQRETLDLAYARRTLEMLEEALMQSDLVPAFETLLRHTR